ncbi:hypothetical protein [Halobacillus yeomjeoni]|uniref:Lipoprotein n=1 Tax=Halobacillus yeomjeoni TaxID=311194 RepID=A0A931HT12_9BACI|nr:hypothetical protein [Halobacillus yeomjeoni]MBH0228843.1 hypothetical protein [Halobacillus yeomjeoni]
MKRLLLIAVVLIAGLVGCQSPDEVHDKFETDARLSLIIVKKAHEGTASFDGTDGQIYQDFMNIETIAGRELNEKEKELRESIIMIRDSIGEDTFDDEYLEVLRLMHGDDNE